MQKYLYLFKTAHFKRWRTCPGRPLLNSSGSPVCIYLRDLSAALPDSNQPHVASSSAAKGLLHSAIADGDLVRLTRRNSGRRRYRDSLHFQHSDGMAYES